MTKINNYSVYSLIDYRGYVYYIGITKNLEIRLYEHTLCDRKNKQRDIKVKQTIEKIGHLSYKSKSGLTLQEAQKLEKYLICKYKPQLTNKHPGGNLVLSQPKHKKQRIIIKRRRRCPYCGKMFFHIGKHKCKEKPNGK